MIAIDCVGKHKPFISLKGHSAGVDFAAFKRSHIAAVRILPNNALHLVICTANLYPFCRCVVAGMFTGNRAARITRHIGDAILFTVNRMSALGTLVLIKGFIVFPCMRLFFLRKATAIPDMILAVA